MVRYPNAKREIKLSVKIRPGPASLSQKTAWHKFWQRLIADVKAVDCCHPKPKGGDRQ